jgi:hypothetical protein
LGGGEAAVASLYTDHPAYTFNAEGVNQSMISSLGLPVSRAPDLITDYYIRGEPLTSWQNAGLLPRALGTQVAVPASITATQFMTIAAADSMSVFAGEAAIDYELHSIGTMAHSLDVFGMR